MEHALAGSQNHIPEKSKELPGSQTIALLGIPVDNLSNDETVDHIFSMIDAYGNDGIPRQVATVNVDFVVNTLSWRFGHIRHPELIDILRRADLVTPDGMPIVWLSRLLGCSLKERVTGADLVPRLAKEAEKRQKSLYFLGGRGDVGRQAADLLQQRYPGLKIAGVDSPFVHVDGEAIASAEEEDRPIIDRINRSGADVLLIAFGNPKQEIWFDRNRKHLKVPVSIGIGGTYEFIIGSVKRAPKWIQKSGFEWIYRITQDPVRLWKRYFVGFFKFGLMVMPAVLYHHYRHFVNRIFPQKDVPEQSPSLSSQATTLSSVAVIKFPKRLDAAFLKQSQEKTEPMLRQISSVILDFSQTTFIDSTGMGFLIKLWRKTTKDEKNLYMLGVNTTIIHFFKLNRLWDLFKEKTCENVNEAMRLLKQKNVSTSFYFSMESNTDHMLIRLFGRLDAAQMSKLDFKSILDCIGERNCILDLKDLTFVDSSGLIFFIKLQKHLDHMQKRVVMCTLNDSVKQMAKITKLDQLFRIVPSFSLAKKELEALV